MKSADVIKSYYERRKEINDGIKSLAQGIEADKATYQAKNDQYKDYVRTGKDDEADALLDEIQSLDSAIKKKETRLNTKRSLVGETLKEKALETLSYAKHVKDEYEPEIDEIDEKVVGLLAEVNELLTVKSDRIEDYEDEYSNYTKIFDDMTRVPDEKTKEFQFKARKHGGFASTPPKMSRLNREFDIKVISKQYNQKAGNK